MELTAAVHNIRQLYHNDHRNPIPRIADKEKDDSRGRGRQQMDGDKKKDHRVHSSLFLPQNNRMSYVQSLEPLEVTSLLMQSPCVQVSTVQVCETSHRYPSTYLSAE